MFTCHRKYCHRKNTSPNNLNKCDARWKREKSERKKRQINHFWDERNAANQIHSDNAECEVKWTTEEFSSTSYIFSIDFKLLYRAPTNTCVIPYNLRLRYQFNVEHFYDNMRIDSFFVFESLNCLFVSSIKPSSSFLIETINYLSISDNSKCFSFPIPTLGIWKKEEKKP